MFCLVKKFMFNYSVNNKNLDSEITTNETPNLNITEDKLLISKNNVNQPRKVDINVLKARVQAVQHKENKKNIAVVIFFSIILGAIGVYFSI